MKRKYIFVTLFLLGIGFFFFIIATPNIPSIKNNVIPTGGSLSLIIEPNDGITPVLKMIAVASSSVDLVMYELDDAQIEAALVADQKRGVAVRVILSGGYKGASSTMNVSEYDFLRANGVPVRWSPAYFSLTHEKSLVVDGRQALIMTFNLVSKYYATGRDFGIVDDDQHDIATMEDTFNDDWNGSRDAGMSDSENASLGGNNGDAGADLLWSPGAEKPLIDFINGARSSLYIYNEEMADADVTKALIDAAERGVVVYVDMTGAAEWKWEFEELTTAGAHVRVYADDPAAPLYIHAKMIVVDAGSPSPRAFVGSENFSKGSLNENRELGMMVSDRAIIASLAKTFMADWRGATPFVP
jgi:phosphatidylserine/phosphatidylglycerophosphate/cardiolipin synthase-like enzyme